MIYLQLFYTFFVIGIFTFGGGYAMLSLIQNEVVVNHQWIDHKGFTDIIAISQMTPGPIGINSATYLGYTVTGNIFGSVVASVAVMLPSFIIILSICRLMAIFRKNIWFNNLMTDLRPVVVGMIGAAAVSLMNGENFIDYISWILFAAAFIAGKFYKANPILTILAGGLAGYIIYI